MKRLMVLLGVLCLVILYGNALALTVSVSSAQGKPGDTNISVPISISNLTANDLMNMELNLTYDNGRLEVTDVQSGALTGSWTKYYNPNDGTGVLKICLLNVDPMPIQTGTVAIVRFSVKSSAAAGQSALTLSKAIFKLSYADVINNGTFTVIGTGPSINPFPAYEIKTGQLLFFNIIATGENLIYSASGIPAGAIFDPAAHTFSWTPKTGQEGKYSVTFTVTDGSGKKASQTANINVTPVSPGNFNLTFEAETGKLTSPMQIKNDSSASGGKLVYSKKDHKGSVSYTFNVPASGDYRIWCRVKSHNSLYKKVFYVFIDGKEKYLKNKHVNSWEWLIVKTEPHGSTYHYKVYLTAGTHKMVIKGREKNAYLDKLLITSDLNLNLEK